MRWLDDHTDVDCDVYDLSFEELALTLAASDFSFPLWKPQTGRMELVSLSTRYEKATLSYLFFASGSLFVFCGLAARILMLCCLTVTTKCTLGYTARVVDFLFVGCLPPFNWLAAN